MARGAEIAHKTQYMGTQGEISYEDMSDYALPKDLRALLLGAAQHRSLSYRHRQSAYNGGSDRRVVICSRKATEVIGSELANCGPEDPVARDGFAQALVKSRYDNDVAFPSTAIRTFM